MQILPASLISSFSYYPVFKYCLKEANLNLGIMRYLVSICHSALRLKGIKMFKIYIALRLVWPAVMAIASWLIILRPLKVVFFSLQGRRTRHYLSQGSATYGQQLNPAHRTFGSGLWSCDFSSRGFWPQHKSHLAGALTRGGSAPCAMLQQGAHMALGDCGPCWHIPC